jgi:hypothetical protein
MSEWNYDGGDNGPSETLGKMAQERCKPDYEQAIKNQRLSIEKLQNLYDSVHEIVFNNEISTGLRLNQMRDLLGTLHVEIEKKNKGIELLIKQQEQDQ